VKIINHDLNQNLIVRATEDSKYVLGIYKFEDNLDLPLAFLR
jgi:hypothetical protein